MKLQREQMRLTLEANAKALESFATFSADYIGSLQHQNQMIMDLLSSDPAPQMPDIMSYKQAATYLDMPLGTLYHMKSKNKIPYVKLSGSIRFKKADLDAWIEKNRVSRDIRMFKP